MTAEPPKPVTGKFVQLDLTGYLFPAHADRQPVLLRIDGADGDLFLPVFSTPKKLIDGMELAQTAWSRMQQILNGGEFLDSLEENTLKLRVIADPYKHESGTLRFQEVIRGS